MRRREEVEEGSWQSTDGSGLHREQSRTVVASGVSDAPRVHYFLGEILSARGRLGSGLQADPRKKTTCVAHMHATPWSIDGERFLVYLH